MFLFILKVVFGVPKLGRNILPARSRFKQTREQKVYLYEIFVLLEHINICFTKLIKVTVTTFEIN